MGPSNAPIAIPIQSFSRGSQIEALAVYRWTPDDDLLVLTAQGEERIRAEPFDAVELSVHDRIGGDDEDESPGLG